MRLFSPVLWKEGVILIGLQVFDFFEQVFNPHLWIDSSAATGDQERAETRSALGAFIRGCV
jgi:hypothetical protein